MLRSPPIRPYVQHLIIEDAPIDFVQSGAFWRAIQSLSDLRAVTYSEIGWPDSRTMKHFDLKLHDRIQTLDNARTEPATCDFRSLETPSLSRASSTATVCVGVPPGLKPFLDQVVRLTNSCVRTTCPLKRHLPSFTKSQVKEFRNACYARLRGKHDME